MLDLAKHIIETKAGAFDPRSFDDRYDQALAELVRAKMKGREIKAPTRPKEEKVVSVMDALRRSAEGGKAGAGKKTTTKAAQRAGRGEKNAAAAARRTQREETGQ